MPLRSAVAKKTPQATGECPPSRRSVSTHCFAPGNAVARTEGVRALPSVGRSLTQSPPRVFDVRAGVCVCLCACVPACAGAVTPRSAVAGSTSRAARKSPSPSRRRRSTYCRRGYRLAHSLRACVRCRRWVVPSRSRRHASLTSAPMSASACVCVRACVRGRRYCFVPGECRRAYRGRACASVGGSVPHAVAATRV